MAARATRSTSKPHFIRPILSGVVVRVQSGKPVIRSKWGTGSVFEHGPDDVPPAYGNGSFFREQAGNHMLRAQ